MRVHFLSVGRADCTLVELPDGKIMLIDGGSSDASCAESVKRAFSSLRIKKIDYLVVGFESESRIGGLERVLESVEIGKAFLPCRADLSLGETYRSLVSAVLEKAANVCYAVRGDRAEGENYRALFLSPRSRAVQSQGRSALLSAVLRLEYAGVGFLFCGDATAEVLDGLRLDYLLDPEAFGAPVDFSSNPIVKIASHGAEGSTSEEFLSFLGWEVAVLSCAAGDPTAPAGETAANLRLSNEEGRVYRTDECGNVMITVSADGKYTVSNENGIK